MNDQKRMLEELHSPEFKGALSDTLSSILYLNQNSSMKSVILPEYFMTVATVIYTPKNFFLLDTINDEIASFKSNGLIKYWHHKLLSNAYAKADPSNEPKVIKVEHLLGCFKVWLWGLSLSSLIFLGEFASKKLARKRFRVARNNLKQIQERSLF